MTINSSKMQDTKLQSTDEISLEYEPEAGRVVWTASPVSRTVLRCETKYTFLVYTLNLDDLDRKLMQKTELTA